VDKLSEQVRSGVSDLRKAGARLGEVIGQVHSLRPRFRAVNQGMQLQSQVAQQINDAMVRLSKATRQTADSLQESNHAIQHVSEAAKSYSEFSLFKMN
jgi:methyl-accepting chemotaxis protein WspA